jgi:hypothetical protein
MLLLVLLRRQTGHLLLLALLQMRCQNSQTRYQSRACKNTPTTPTETAGKETNHHQQQQQHYPTHLVLRQQAQS